MTDGYFFDTDCLSAFLWVRGESMEVGSAEYHDYLQMTTAPKTGMQIIGSGEAASIAMVEERGGIMASNNMRDILPYVIQYGLKHITTGDILVEAMDSGIITEEEGNVIWANMLRKRRMLPTATFSDYIKNKQIGSNGK